MEIFTYHRNKGSDFRIGLLIFDPQCFWPAIHWLISGKQRRQRIFQGIQVAVIPMTFRLRLLVFFVCGLVLSSASFARSSNTTTNKSKASGNVTENARAQKRMARLRHKRAARRHVVARSAAARSTSAKATGAKVSATGATLKTVSLHRRRTRHRWVEQFTGNSFSDDNTDGDIVEGEDPVVR